MKRLFVIFLTAALALSGCYSADYHKKQVGSDRDLTLGKVQREIRVGMSGAQVIEVLGSPNVVSTDEKRREVWVYDKISTETAYSRSEGGATIIVLGSFKEAGATSTSQQTLTIIVKFDDKGVVRDLAYHSSRF
jgi:outer membrane protein assembly factor BamE (lipoprotein component of BamABCDE complex)